MYLLLVILVYIFFAKIFVDWKKWKEYYPTIQYFIISNMLYNFIFYQHTLWAYKAVTVKWLNHTLIELVFSFFIIPVVIMIYLRYLPKGKKILVYIGIWVAYFSFLEFLFVKKGIFIYENGWGIIWSTLFNIILFGMVTIHYKRPMAALILSVPVMAVLLFIFHPSLSELK
ncbi:CBO0543 family protein [Neobacillus sp. PS3-34]|uniref:CBO0543 family protein n=1 Tax=Neobacillus sp. PS3-34 TaxID=3070678 RepID=UPI0027E0EA88|nr:CBO0543 family protein [Neobacillus sp. PS3-34]WML49360.1 CBO0543 family protein [Neobacillus sp. PS3-34]